MVTMKIFLLVILGLIANALALVKEENDPVLRGTYTTRLNHFDPQDRRSVNLAYKYNPIFAKEGGPLLVLVNSGEVNEDEWLRRSLMHDAARDVNGTLFSLYIRNFGPNNITETSSTDNLKYLTVEQILADIAVFVETIRNEFHQSNSRVILSGSGLGGTLATWAHQRFPHLVYSSWSSSGSFDRTVYTPEPYEALTRTITDIGGQQCADNVFRAFDNVLAHFERYNIFYVQEIFNLCVYIIPYYLDEVAMFYNGLIDYIVQHLNAHHRPGIEDLCDALNKSSLRPMEETFAKWVLNNYGSDGECLDYDYDNIVRKLRFVTWDSEAAQMGARQRLYLQCTQLATHKTTEDGNTIFTKTVFPDYYNNLCRGVFGYYYNFNTSIEAMNYLKVHFGTKDPGASRAIFSNGVLDINRAFGITEDDDEPDNYIINISDAAKSVDFFEMSEEDNIHTALAKFAIHEIIVKWSTED